MPTVFVSFGVNVHHERLPGRKHFVASVVLDNGIPGFIPVECADDGFGIYPYGRIDDRRFDAQLFEKSRVIAKQVIITNSIGLPGFTQSCPFGQNLIDPSDRHLKNCNTGFSVAIIDR